LEDFVTRSGCVEEVKKREKSEGPDDTVAFDYFLELNHRGRIRIFFCRDLSHPIGSCGESTDPRPRTPYLV